MPDIEQDFIVSSLLSELKNENNRKDKLIKSLIKIICGCVLVVLATVASFLLFLNQYDYTSTETINTTATGVYALVDSKGNIVVSDLSSEEVQTLMEVLNGSSNGNNNSD